MPISRLHEEDKKGVDTTAWVALEDLRPAYDSFEALSEALDAFDDETLEGREGVMALIHAGRRSWREAQTARSGARAAARGANGARDAMQRYK